MPKALTRVLSFWWWLMGAMKINFLFWLPTTISKFQICSHVIVSNPYHIVRVILPNKVLVLCTNHTMYVHSGTYAVFWFRIMHAFVWNNFQYVLWIFMVPDTGNGWLLSTWCFSEHICRPLEAARSCSCKYMFCLIGDIFELTAECLFGIQLSKMPLNVSYKVTNCCFAFCCCFQRVQNCRSCNLYHSNMTVWDFLQHLKWHKTSMLK